MVVPVTTGELHIFDGKTTVPAPLKAGLSYARLTGVEHDVINPERLRVRLRRDRAQGLSPAAPRTSDFGTQGGCIDFDVGKPHMRTASGPARSSGPHIRDTLDRARSPSECGLTYGN